MKTSLKTLALGLMAISMTAAHAQDAVNFARKFTAGAVEKYSLSSTSQMSMDMSGMGQGSMDMNSTTSADVTYTVGSVDKDGNAVINFLYSNFKMTSEGPMAEMMNQGGGDFPSEMKGSFTLTPFLQSSGFKIETELPGPMKMMMEQMGSSMDLFSVPFLPKAETKKGSTWEVTMPDTVPGFAKGQKLAGTFTGEADFNGKPAWRIVVSGKPKMEMDIGKMMRESNPDSPEMTILLEGTSEMTTTLLLEKGTNRVLLSDTKTTFDAMVKLPDMGAQFPQTGTVISKFVAK